MTDDLQLLISAYLDGEEVDALRDRLASDPKALTEFVLALDVHGELRKIFLEGKGNAAALKEIRRAKRWRWVAAAVAATALVAWALLGRSTSLPRVESLAGTVRPAVAVGQEVSELETLGDGRATLRYPDGTSLVLGPGTRVRELAPNRVSLTRGSLAAEVTPRADPLVFSTPHGDAKVLGTSLKLAVEKASTRLEVTEGRVRLTRGGDAVEVAAGHFAVAAKDVKPEAKTLVAERVRRMAPNSWLALPGTKLRAVAPSNVKGDPRGVMESWSGGVLDTRRNRLVVWGGGHTNYYGNEVYAFDLESLRWERLTEPSPVTAGSQVNTDGTPSARGTYNGLAYVAHADRMFALGGDPAGSGPTPDLLWTFDFADHAWEDRQPSGDRPPTWVGALCAYDPATRTVWWGEGRSPGIAGLYAYEIDANRWVKHTADFFYYQTGALDTRRGLLVCAGDGKLFAHDVRQGAPIRQAWGEAFVGMTNPGFDYDAAKDRLVAWAGGPVRVLHPETRVWTSIDAPGAPKPTPNGIFGRWRYVPSLDVFVVVTGIDDDVHFFKLGD